MNCDLVCYIPVPLIESNLLFSNAEILTDIAEVDLGVLAGSGYPKGALVVFNPSIAISTDDNNTSYLGASGASAKWVYNQSVAVGTYLLQWNSSITYSIDDLVSGSYDSVTQKYYTYTSIDNGNKSNTLPITTSSNASWAYDGLKDYQQLTRTDISGSFKIGENYWSGAQQKGFTAIVDITADVDKVSGEAPNAVPFVTDEGTEAQESKWVVIDVINPLRFLQPSITQKTFRDTELIFEFKLDRRAKHIGFFGLEGDNLELTIWDSLDAEVFNENYELIKEALDYEEWAYDPIEKQTQLFIQDIPWDSEIRVRVEITGATNAVGLIYPCNEVTFGTLDFSPQQTFIDATEEVRSEYNSELGVVKEHPIKTITNFTAYSNPENHDIIKANIIEAKLASNASKLPLLLSGTDKYQALKEVLGRAPKITQRIVNSGRTETTIEIEGVIQ